MRPTRAARRRLKAFAALLPFTTLLLATAARAQSPADRWVGVSTPRYLFVGNAPEPEVRRAAARFELFAAAFSELFPAHGAHAPVPTRVFVFRDYESFRPFRPLYDGDAADFKGYFQPGADVNHIVVPLALTGDDPQQVHNHEAVHLLLAATARRVPDWLGEGLAQYYSTLRVSDGGAATLGSPVARHAALLRKTKLLAPARLFEIDRGSREYRSGAGRELFYAQSWATVHYLASSDAGRGHLRLFRFLEMLASGLKLEEGLRRAFDLDFDALERGLARYVRRGRYETRELSAGGAASGEAELKSAPLGEAEAEFYLGDLLLHVGRFAEAEKHLRRAVSLDRASARGYTSLGMALARQRRFPAARQSLRRAVALAPDSYLAHYYHAYALSREEMEDEQTVEAYAPELAAEIRAALERAIKLEPRFPESYRLLAFVNLVTGERLDEAVGLLDRGLALAPNRPDLLFVLAQVQLRRGDRAAARASLEKIAGSGASPRLRARAESLLRELASK